MRHALSLMTLVLILGALYAAYQSVKPALNQVVSERTLTIMLCAYVFGGIIFGVASGVKNGDWRQGVDQVLVLAIHALVALTQWSVRCVNKLSEARKRLALKK